MKPNRTQFSSANSWVRGIVQLFGLVGFLCLVNLSGPLTPAAYAFDPHFRLPWVPGVGWRISGTQYNFGLHLGADYYAIDFGVPFNNEVRAAQGGYATTAVAGAPPSYGRYVIIDHGNGFITLYAHLNGFAIANGVNVIQGQLIGWAGDTGAPGQFHLHFSARINGVAYMPEPMSGYTGFGNPANFNSTIYYDGPQLSNGLANGSFDTDPIISNTDYCGGGGGQWVRSSGSCFAPVGGGAPNSGSRYLEINSGTTGVGGWIYQLFPLSDANWSNFTPNRTFVNTPDTWTVHAWMKTPNCAGYATGTLAVWALSGSQEAGSTGFTLDGTWRQYLATTTFNNNGHNRLQTQIYFDTPGCNYDIDGRWLD